MLHIRDHCHRSVYNGISAELVSQIRLIIASSVCIPRNKKGAHFRRVPLINSPSVKPFHAEPWSEPFWNLLMLNSWDFLRISRSNLIDCCWELCFFLFFLTFFSQRPVMVYFERSFCIALSAYSCFMTQKAQSFAMSINKDLLLRACIVKALSLNWIFF